MEGAVSCVDTISKALLRSSEMCRLALRVGTDGVVDVSPQIDD